MKLSKCHICKRHLPLSYFYKAAGRANGVGSRCKECHNEYFTKRNKSRKEYFRKYQELNKEKMQAKWKLQYAIRSGKIKRGNCEVCGQEKAGAHHDDYEKPYDVRWFCHKHHMAEHYG